MNKVFKYKLRPNSTQRNTFEQWTGTCRFVYNLALEHRITAYQSAKVSVSEFDQNNELKHIKKTEGFQWIGDVYSQVLQDVVKRVDRSYKNFFRGAGFPKWAKRGQYNSFTFPQINNLRIENNRIKLPKIGFVKLWYHRNIEGIPKQIQIVKQLNSWYICIVCKIEPKQFKGENQAVGIDLGVTRLATLSDGSYFNNPKFFNHYRSKLRIKQRKLSRQKKFGANWYKTKHQISKLHHKIANCRKDYLHKVSHEITSKFNIVIMEDLKLSNMTKSAKGTLESHGKMVKQKSGLNRSLLDSGLAMLSTMIEYKTKHQGGLFSNVLPALLQKTRT